MLAGMKKRQLSQGEISRETGLSYNTVKKYLERLEAEATPTKKAE